MFDRIIVPLDGTRFSELALQPARDLASRFHSRILVTQAIKPFSEEPFAFQSENSNMVFHLEQVDEADAYLRGIVERLRGEGYDSDFTLYIGEPGSSITKIAALRHADLIVMNMRLRWKVDPHSRNPGSVTLRVLRRTRTPILTLHMTDEKQTTTAQAMPQIVRPDAPIVVPLDGSSFAEEALPVAESLARAFGSYLVLVSAVAPSDISLEVADSVDAIHSRIVREREALEYVTRVRAEVEARGVPAMASVEVGMPISVIERVWQKQDAALIVMASHGASGHHGMLLGSVAAAILEELAAPVLVVQPKGMPPIPGDGALVVANPEPIESHNA